MSGLGYNAQGTPTLHTWHAPPHSNQLSVKSISTDDRSERVKIMHSRSWGGGRGKLQFGYFIDGNHTHHKKKKTSLGFYLYKSGCFWIRFNPGSSKLHQYEFSINVKSLINFTVNTILKHHQKAHKNRINWIHTHELTLTTDNKVSILSAS